MPTPQDLPQLYLNTPILQGYSTMQYFLQKGVLCLEGALGGGV